MISILTATSVTDPLGRNVLFPKVLFMDGDANPVSASMYQLLIKAVETPSCLIELPDGSRCYFGFINQTFTSLLEIVERGGEWLVQRCVKNPPLAEIQALLKKGKFIAGRSLD